MDQFRRTVLTMQLIEAAVVIVLAVPLTLRKVGPNSWYGFRTRRSLANLATWYEVNAHAGRGLIGAGLAIGILSLGLYFAGGIDGQKYAWACTGVSLASIVVATGRSIRYLRRLPG